MEFSIAKTFWPAIKFVHLTIKNGKVDSNA